MIHAVFLNYGQLRGKLLVIFTGPLLALISRCYMYMSINLSKCFSPVM